MTPRILLISNCAMHYRILVYNYFAQEFSRLGRSFIVRATDIQKQNPHNINFDMKCLGQNVIRYLREVQILRPEVVILFLHLKDVIFWPMLHWLRLNRIPTIFWTKGGNMDRPHSLVRYLLFNYVHALVNRIILYSPREIRLIAPRNRSKIFVANNALNEFSFPLITESKETIKKSLGLPYEKIILFVGRMDVGGGRKRVEDLISAFEGIDVEGAGLVVVGRGISELARKRLNAVRGTYLGEIYDPDNIQISKIFKASDVFCVPGHIGLSINQAFYWGLPVVTGDKGQSPEIWYLEDGLNGFIVESGNIEMLRGRLRLLLMDDELRHQMGRAAKERISRDGSVTKMFEGFQKCIESLA